MKKDVKKVTALGIGIALFVVTSYLSIPTGIPNTSVQTRVAVLSFFSVVFGPFVGFAVGFLGHAIADAIQYGGIWWSWVIADGVLGLIIGLFYLQFDINKDFLDNKKIIAFNAMQTIANGLCWVVVAPVLDIVIYKEPTLKVFGQGITSAIINIISIGIIGTLLIYIYSKRKTGFKDLTKEE